MCNNLLSQILITNIVLKIRKNKALFGFYYYFFSSLITHHSIFVTYHSSLITHYSLFKIPQFPQPHSLITQASHHSHFSDFCGTHTCNLVRPKMLAYSRTYLFLFSHFPFTLVALPKPKPEPIKILEAPSPHQDRH